MLFSACLNFRLIVLIVVLLTGILLNIVEIVILRLVIIIYFRALAVKMTGGYAHLLNVKVMRLHSFLISNCGCWGLLAYKIVSVL